MLLVVFSLLVFAAVSVAVYAVWGQVTADANPVQARLRELRSRRFKSGGTAREERPPFLIHLIARIGGFMPAREGRDTLRTGLVRAGFRRPEAVLVLLGSKIVFAVLIPVLWLTSITFAKQPVGELAAWVPFWALGGFYLPTLFIAARQKQRHDSIQGALPDALDLMVVCVEAGLGVSAAMQRVAGEIRIASRDLSTELNLVHQEIQAGVPRPDALRHLARRSGVDEVYMLVAMLIQTDRLGTSVADTLRSHAESMRIRRRQRAEELARKAGVKLAFPLVFLILPALLVVILGPAAIQLMKALKAG